MPVSRKKITEGQGNCNCLIVLLDCFPLTFFFKKKSGTPTTFFCGCSVNPHEAVAGGRLYSPLCAALGGDVRAEAGQCKTLSMAVYHNGKAACNWSTCIIPRKKRSTASVARTSSVLFVVDVVWVWVWVWVCV